MLRYFREHRRIHFKSGDFGKYLAYATGELVLVVIGILIALYLNRVREEQINERHNQQLVKAVLNELVNNIQVVDQTLRSYVRIDSIRRVVLYCDQEPADFEDLYLEKLQQITLSRSASPKNAAYHSLVLNTRDIPDNLRPVLTQLQRVQVIHDELNLDQDINVSLWRKADEYLSLNYPWYSLVPDRSEQVKDQLLDFMASDFIYKNMLRDRLSTQHNYVSDLFWYRNAAVEAALAIRGFLGIRDSSIHYQANPGYRRVLGKYEGISFLVPDGRSAEISVTGRFPNEAFQIVETDGRLWFQQLRDSVPLTEVMSISDQVLIDASGVFWHFMSEGLSGDTLLVNGLFDNDIGLVKSN